MRRPLHSGLNLLSLSFGIAVFMVLSLLVHVEGGHRGQAGRAEALQIAGLLVFLVALINTANLEIARAGLRAREVAVRKASGADLEGLRLQFVVEGIVIGVVALAGAFSLVELTLPAIDLMAGLTLSVDYARDGPILAGLVVAVLSCTVLSGIYPAVVLSNFHPAHILSGSRVPSGSPPVGRRLRELLAGLQFSAATALFIIVLDLAPQAGQASRLALDLRLFAAGGGVAAVIAAIGLFGLAAFDTSIRLHEIGVRKSFGASRRRIVGLLMLQFLRPVLIANLVAWPAACLVIATLGRRRPQPIPLDLSAFLTGSALSLLIATVTVVGVAWAAARTSPGKALRQD
jgi:ABC-type antimicrobial peptide transport system permease subunit